jgi:DNA adenine methylase
MVGPTLEMGPTALLAQQTLLTPGPRIRVSPLVKWAGGKGHLLRYLIPFIPTRLSNYYEAFLGGGALFFSLFNRGSSFTAFLSDTNEDLIATYMVVKEKPVELIQQLQRMQRQYLLSNDKAGFYYRIRRSSPSDRIGLAVRFLFLNKTCYNGLYRVNSHGDFNVPFGRYTHPRVVNEENLVGVSRALKETNARVVSVDYLRATESCRKGDFVYFDPPYDPASKTSAFTDYTPNGFDEQDQIELSNRFADLAGRGCDVLLSNSDTHLIRKLYRRYNVRSVEVSRPISCKGKSRGGFKELIISSRPLIQSD